MDQLNEILSLLDKIQGLPAAGLVFVLCIAIGYAWRGLNFQWFPNQAIPTVVMVSGALCMMLIADGRPTTMPHHVWTARNFAVGFIIGAIAWAVHNYVIAKFIEPWLVSKMPSLGNSTLFSPKPTTPTPPTDAGQPSANPPK